MSLPDQYVTVIDADADGEQIQTGRFSEFQRSRAPTVASGLVDCSRVVVVSPTAMATKLEPLLEQINVSPSVKRVLCVFRGETANGSLQLPEIVARPSVAALWVGDPRGVLWKMGSARASAITIHPDDPDGDAAFDATIDCLSLPEVFDASFERAKETGVAVSPGIRMFVPGAADQKLVEAAEGAALTALTRGGRPNVELSMADIPSDLESRSALFGEAAAPAELFDANKKIGRLARAVESRRASVEQAVQKLFERPPVSYGPVQHVAASVRSVGDALGLLKAELKTLFETVDGSNGLDTAELRALKAVGLRPGSTKAAATDDLTEETIIRRHALNELRRTRSLQEVVGELRHIEERATPRTAAETVAVLEDACPDSLIEDLRTHPPLRVRGDDWRSLLLLAGVVASSAMMFFPWAILPLLALVCLMGFFLFVTYPLAAVRELRTAKLADRLKSRHVYLWSVAIFFGFVVGEAVRDQAGSTPLYVAASIAAPLLFVALVLSAWRSSSRRWLGAARLAEAKDATDRLLATTADVVMNDWVLANTRTRFASITGRLAASLEELRVALLGPLAPGKRVRGDKGGRGRAAQPDQAEASSASGPTGTYTCNPAIRSDLSDAGAAALRRHSGLLEDIVLKDYLDAVAATIEEQWGMICSSEEKEGSEACLNALKRRVGWYRSMLRRSGLFGTRLLASSRDEATLSAEGARRRHELLAELWENLDLEVVLALTTDADIVQLCAPDDLVLLDHDPESATLIRFAPATQRARPSATDITRTSSMAMSGVIRLVPVRAGTVVVGQAEDVLEALRVEQTVPTLG